LNHAEGQRGSGERVAAASGSNEGIDTCVSRGALIGIFLSGNDSSEGGNREKAEYGKHAGQNPETLQHHQLLLSVG
jgi:hypothetical protein